MNRIMNLFTYSLVTFGFHPLCDFYGNCIDLHFFISSCGGNGHIQPMIAVQRYDASSPVVMFLFCKMLFLFSLSLFKTVTGLITNPIYSISRNRSPSSTLSFTPSDASQESFSLPRPEVTPCIVTTLISVIIIIINTIINLVSIVLALFCSVSFEAWLPSSLTDLSYC